MNSMIAANINGNSSSINQKVASGSRSSILSSSIEFNLTEIRSNFSAPCLPGKYLVKLSGKEVLLNGQNKNQNCDQNKNPIGNSYANVNGNKDKSAEDSIPIPKVHLYTGKIHVEWNQVYKIGAGLNNLGNTCFMNTVIQCLTYCPPLANYLLHDNDHASKCSITGFCMMCLLQKHMKRAIGKTGEVIKPIDVYQRLKLIAKHFQFGRQEDAHEFLRYVIDHLWKACLPQANGVTKLDPASKETTVINKIFGGYHRSQVICLRCKKESNTFDHFMDFILDIKQNVMSLEKALEKYIQPELLQQENSYKCPKCKMKVDAQKRFTVYRPPTVATFQLKRFDYNRSFGGKITKQVTYPERLNLRPYMSEPQGEPVWYRLNAVLVHSGPSCTSGHYYCYVKNSNGLWYIMDDQRVHQVSLNQVLNQSAYVLFYIKTESGDRTPLKKCVDNKSSFVKGSISNSPFSKVPEMNNLKPSPLSEKVTPFSNSKQQFNSPAQVKKFNFSTPNREKISFGFRTGMSNGPISSPKSKVLSPAPTSATSGGLVPYVEDSSESSDASESNPPVVTQQNSPADSEGKQNIKNSSLSNYSSSPRLEIKTKLSKSVFNSPAQNYCNVLPKVSATGSWTVTGATEITPPSSSTGVNSTTDWQVINAKSSDFPKESDAKDSCENESSDTSKSMPIILPSEVPTARQAAGANEDSNSSPNISKLAGRESSPSSQKSNFRKQQQKFKSYFLEGEETAENSFKRKCSDSYSEVSKDSPISEHSESRYSSLPKKVKYAEKTPFMNGDIDSSNLDISDRDNSSVNFPQQRQYSTSNCDNSSRTHTSLHEISSGVPPNSKSSTSVSESEKYINSPEKDSVFPKAKHKEKSSFSESPKPAQYEKKVSPIFNHLKNDSSSLYGTEVPTWRGENVYRPASVVPSHDNRRSFDDYDNEFDRGKVRKSKPKDQYNQYFHRKNPFQKHADRYHNKYNGRFYNNYRSHKKPYDSHHNWKPSHDYQRYGNHHQRRY